MSSTTTFTRVLQAAILAGAMVWLIVQTLAPIWQIHDDAYYAMIADGYGIAGHPSVMIPYMHPLIGEIIGAIHSLTGHFAYSIFLYLAIFAGCASVVYRVSINRGWLAATLFLLIGSTPVLLLPQYSTVSGFLVACVAVLWMRDTRSPICYGELLYGLILIFIATLLRKEMAVFALICLAPIVISDNPAFRLNKGSGLVKLFTGFTCIIVGYYVLEWVFMSPELEKFYQFNDPPLRLTNFGYADIITQFATPLPAGVSTNDLALIQAWFLVEPSTHSPQLLAKLYETVSPYFRLKAGYWNAIHYVKSLNGTLFFWFIACSTWLSLFSKYPRSCLAGIGLLAITAMTFIMLGKEFPERVALGVSIGLFFLTAFTIKEKLLEQRKPFLIIVGIACLLLIPAAWNITKDRLDIQKLSTSLQVYQVNSEGNDTLYVWVGSLPLRGIFRPFDIKWESPPPLVFLGSMYGVPSAVEREAASPCGGFLKCLADGKEIKLLTPAQNIDLLRTLLLERYGRHLKIIRQSTNDKFAFYILSTESI